MTGLCPNCGYDLALDQAIERDGVRIEPRSGGVWWKGAPVRLTRAEFELLHAIIKADGHLVTSAALAERLGYEGDLVKQNVHQRLTQVRKRMPGVPIATLWGRGFLWMPASAINAEVNTMRHENAGRAA